MKLGQPRVVQDVERESGLIFLNLELDVYGNVSELGNEHRCPGKSSLFFLTKKRPWKRIVRR
jgi:hypothetical protein